MTKKKKTVYVQENNTRKREIKSKSHYSAEARQTSLTAAIMHTHSSLRTNTKISLFFRNNGKHI